MFPKTKSKSFKKVVTVSVALIVILAMSGILKISPMRVQAGGYYDIRYVDDGGSTPDIFLNDAATAELCFIIEAMEESAGSNTIDSVTLEITDTYDENNNPTGFTLADLAEVALYLDNGNGAFDGSPTDTFIASSSPSVVPATWALRPSGMTRWFYIFQNVDFDIPTSWGANNAKILVTAKGTAAAIAATTTRGFHFQIPENGVDVTATATGATLTDFPRATGGGGMSMWFSPPIFLGQESGAGGMGSPLVISEIQTMGGEATDEFIELYNRSPDPVNLTNYRIAFNPATSTSLTPWSASTTITGNVSETTTVPGYGFYLIAHNDYDDSPSEDHKYSNFNIKNNGFVALLDDSAQPIQLDLVGYGTLDTPSLAEAGIAAWPAPATAHYSLERKAFPDSTFNKMNTGGTHASKGNKEDTNSNGSDFILRTTSDPQNTSSNVEDPSGGAAAGAASVIINEVLFNTATTSGWIELYNRSPDTAQDINEWEIKTNSTTYTVPQATEMAAGGFLVVYWNYGTSTNNTTTTLFTETKTAMSAFGGDVMLKNNVGAIQDYVQYGGSGKANETAATTSAQWMAGDFVPNVLYNQSIGRRSMAGEDLNDSSDWQTYSSPSPGNPNMGGDSTAPDQVTNVVLSDPDNTAGSGINGRDIQIVFTPSSVSDSTFDFYEIYLLPAASTLDMETHIDIDRIYEGQYQYAEGAQKATFTYTGGSYITNDSAGTALNTEGYMAYIIAQDFAGNRSSAARSASTTLTAEVLTDAADTQAPFIMHMPVWQTKDSDNLQFLARAADDGTLDYLKLQYAVGNDTTAPDMSSLTEVTCDARESDFFSCDITFGAWTTTTVIGYYLEAADSASGAGGANISYMSASADADMSGVAATVQANPILIDVQPTSAYADSDASDDLAGTVYDSSGTALSTAYVFIPGTAIGYTTTDGSGVFAIANTKLQAGEWEIVVFKSGYQELMNRAFRNDSGLSLYMNAGSSNMGGGAPPTGGGYMEKPSVIFTNPYDGMMGTPVDNFAMTIGFSKQMKASTVVDNDASNAGSNIYLTSTGQDRVRGAVTYNSSNYEAEFAVSSGVNLSMDTHYSLVITTAVTDDLGNPISGGWRSDGAYESGFNTMMDNTTMWGTGWQDYQQGGQYYDDAMAGGGMSGGEGEYFADMAFDSYGTAGQFMPPYVEGIIPNYGVSGVSKNASIIIEFSEPMDSSTINTDTIQLLPISNMTTWATGDAILGTVALDSATQRIVTLNPDDDLPVNSDNEGWYQIKLMGSIKSASGVWCGDPRDSTQDPDIYLATMPFYLSEFQVDTLGVSDTTKPRVMGTYPSDEATNVDVGLPAIDIGFSEAMTPSTINVQAITLAAGSNTVSGKVKYSSTENSAKFIPYSALSPNTQYTFTIATSTKDLAENPLKQKYSITFKTGAADETDPTVLYANADGCAIAVSFSESMNTAKITDTNRWSTSVLNPANYVLIHKVGSYRTANNLCDAPGAELAGASDQCYSNYRGDVFANMVFATTTCWALDQDQDASSISFSYDPETFTMKIEGLTLESAGAGTPTGGFKFTLQVNNVIDLSGNSINTLVDEATGPIDDRAGTFSMLGPGGGPGMMMMGPGGGGGGMGMMMGPGAPPPTMSGMTGPSMDMGKMMMMEAGAMPMNRLVGQTSMYFVDVPVTNQVKNGQTIILTFPSGFVVSGAKKDPYSPMNNDLNDFGPSVLTISSIATNQTARTITITIATSTVDTNSSAGPEGFVDFLHFDLKGIVNSPIAMDYGTNGYSVDIKHMSAAGALLETVTTMPFYLTDAGENPNTIVAVVYAAGAPTGATTTVFLGSPMTGPMEKVTSAFDVADYATSTFTKLPDGDYHLFTDPYISLGAQKFSGSTMPEPIWISGGQTITRTLTLEEEKAGAGKADITITLQGVFTTGGVKDEVDIFANSPNKFKVITVTPEDDGVTSTVPHSYHLFLTAGEWMVGMSPAMPKGPQMGPPKMPDWMPPMPTHITSDGSTGQTVTIDISGQSGSVMEINGQVVDGLGNGIEYAEVWAYQPMGMFGDSHTTGDMQGNFTLKVRNTGIYGVGAFKPGLPHTKEKSVEVRTQNAANVDGNLTADIYLESRLITAASPLVIKLQKPRWNITGTVRDNNGNPVAYAPVWAYQPQSFGHADAMTNGSGVYTLLVNEGTWLVETDAPGLGWFQYPIPITITDTSPTSTTAILEPADDYTFRDIGVYIKIDNVVQAYTPFRAAAFDCTSGVYLGRDYGGSTNSSGFGTTTVRGPVSSLETQVCYRVDTWNPTYGEIEATTDEVANNPANTIVTSTNRTINIQVTAASLTTTTISFTNGLASQNGFLHIEEVTFTGNIPKPTGFHRHLDVTGLDGTATVKLKGSAQGKYYFFDLNVPGSGFYMPDLASRVMGGKDCIMVTTTARTVNFDLPDTATDVITISGTVKDDAETGVDSAWVWVNDPNSDFRTGTSTVSGGAYAITAPKLSSGDYQIGVDRSGYMAPPASFATGTASATKDLVVNNQSWVIKGYIYADADSDNVYDSGEGLREAYVRAKETTTGVSTQTLADINGYYELGVNNSTSWHLWGGAEQYLETQYQNAATDDTVNILGGDSALTNVALTVDSAWSQKTLSKQIVPAKGGVIDDSAQDASTGKAAGTGIKLIIPPNALGSETAAGKISVKTTVASPSSAQTPLGGAGTKMDAKDSAGESVVKFNDEIIVEKTFYEADIDAIGLIDKGKLKTLNPGYRDPETNAYVEIMAGKKAYYKASAAVGTEWTMYQGATGTTTSPYDQFIDDALVGDDFVSGTNYFDYKLVLTYSTDHFTDFTFGLPADAVAPAAPSGLAQSSGSGSSVVITWNVVSLNADDSACTDLYGYRVYRSTDGSTYARVEDIYAPTVTYTDTDVSSFASYYYKLSAVDEGAGGGVGGNEGVKSAALQVCSNKTVSNGTVAADCSITCNSGYTVSGNACISSGGAVISGGGVSGDTVAPSISGISAVAATTTVTITWQTSESSISWLLYGTSTAYGSEYTGISYKTSHSVSLTGLAEGTTYHFQVKARDSSGNVGSYTDKTFTCLGEAPMVAVAEEEEEVTVPEIVIAPEKPISEMTIAELKAEITRIAGLIADLQAELLVLLGEVVIEGVPAEFTFDSNLKLGMSGDNVKYLQIVLNSAADTQVAETSWGSPGNETTYFGPLTKAAVIKFQEKYTSEILASWDLTQGTGLVGSTTRDKLNELLAQ